MKKFFLIILLFAACKDVYKPALKNTVNNYLVVEGNIVAGNDSTFVHLSRTIAVSDTSIIYPELNASITVEGENGESYPLKPDTNGLYYAPPLNISPNENYRLHIFTADGKEYASDYVPVKQAPPIDSVSWKFDSTKGVNIYVSTHDAESKTLYYQWDYTETWQHRTTYTSGYIYENGILRERKPDEFIANCWSVVPASSITISSAAQLSSDVIYEKQLVNIPYGSEKLSIVYSILVTQNALTKEGYEYWNNLKKNTEELGGIFDPQPFADFGNMHCITDPSEPVVGFISAGSITQQRIYIYESDLSSWPYRLPQCGVDTLKPGDDFSSILGSYSKIALYKVALSGTLSEGFLITDAECGDCRFHGGSTIKPPYMP